MTLPARIHVEKLNAALGRIPRFGMCGTVQTAIADASYYMLTKNGLQAGIAVAGTKYWKDKELN